MFEVVCFLSLFLSSFCDERVMDIYPLESMSVIYHDAAMYAHSAYEGYVCKKMLRRNYKSRNPSESLRIPRIFSQWLYQFKDLR